MAKCQNLISQFHVIFQERKKLLWPNAIDRGRGFDRWALNAKEYLLNYALLQKQQNWIKITYEILTFRHRYAASSKRSGNSNGPNSWWLRTSDQRLTPYGMEIAHIEFLSDKAVFTFTPIRERVKTPRKICAPSRKKNCENGGRRKEFRISLNN